MSLKVGIVGLPNVGKSTLFNALLKKRVALSANYPFATIEPNTGVVAVPDPRLEQLAILVAKEEGMLPSEIASSLNAPRNDEGKDSGQARMTDVALSEDIKKYLPPLLPAVVEFVDIAGLVKGASAGEGLGNQFLSHIREVDAIVHVLRDFADENVIRAGSTDPVSDRETIETELGIADLQTLEKLVINQEKSNKFSKDPLDPEKLKILKQVQDDLGQGLILGKYHFGDERLEAWFRTLPLLSIKPVLYVHNVSENEYADKLRDSSATPQNDSELVICAKVEEELVELEEKERVEYLKELGIEEPGLDRLVRKAYQLLGLISFLTAGKKEVRAWTTKKDAKAPQAAGVIHTDFEKKFIRAEVVEYEKLIEAGSHAAAKTKGWVRTEGKEYVMKDGDVVEFLIGS